MTGVTMDDEIGAVPELTDGDDPLRPGVWNEPAVPAGDELDWPPSDEVATASGDESTPPDDELDWPPSEEVGTAAGDEGTPPGDQLETSLGDELDATLDERDTKGSIAPGDNGDDAPLVSGPPDGSTSVSAASA